MRRVWREWIRGRCGRGGVEENISCLIVCWLELSDMVPNVTLKMYYLCE